MLEKNEFLMHHLSKKIERIYRDKNNNQKPREYP